MEPVSIALEPHKRGDTWDGILSIGPILINTFPPDNQVVSCRMQFRDQYDSLGYELNSVSAVGKGIITIVDPATWEFIIPKQLLPLDTGSWIWDFETTDSEGNIETYYCGTLLVTKDITHA